MAATLPRWSKGQVAWLVNRLHVSATPEDVAASFAPRMNGAGWTDKDRREVVAYAQKVHERNRELWRHVMRGR